MMLIFLAVLVAVLLVGSYTDFRTREVPDWVNYGLIFAGVGLRAILSAVSYSWMPLVSAGIGLGMGIGVAFAMYYLGQWGGGDAKMLMGLGAIIGFDFKDMFFLSFLVNVFVLGAVYGLCYGFVLAIKNWKKFKHVFKKTYHYFFPVSIKKIVVPLTFLVALMALLLFFLFREIASAYLMALVVILVIFFYLLIFAKAVEKCCMLKFLPPEKLTEGDWIAKSVYHKGKYICGPKDLGISKKQIKILKKLNVRKILVKDGIPFVPSFLIAFIFTYYLGNIFLLISF